jgi:serine/threonine protein kinase
MSLEDDQRAWLDKAIREKGRFTRKKGIEKDWESYRRRREKTANALAGLPKDHPERKFVDEALKSADTLAKAGKFNDAHKSLNSAKKRAKAAASERASDIHNDEIRVQANMIYSYLDTSKKEVDFAVRHLDDAINKVAQHAKAGDEPNFDKALKFRQKFAAEEGILRGDFASALDMHKRIAKNVSDRGLPSLFERVEMDIKALQTAGRGDDIADQVKRVADLKTEAQSNDKRYWDWFWMIRRPEPKTVEFEKAIMTVKSLDKWQKREGKGVKRDQKTKDIRSKNLNETDNLEELLQREEDRLDWARKQMTLEQDRDTDELKDTDRGKVTLTPEPEKFDAAATFGDLVDDLLPEPITPEDSERWQKAAAKKLKSFLAQVDPSSDEMFDLSLKSAKDFKVMLGEQLLGVTNPKKWTKSQEEFLEQAATLLEQTLCKHLPNKMSDDGSSITMNGVTYQLDTVLKSGGNGKASRYKDPNTGKTVVVKTLLSGSKESRKNMVWEMQTHRRVMNGLDDTDPNSDSIVEMKGSARSSDGALHMIMEDVQGGDLEDVSYVMQMMQSSGIIPETARQILSTDMIAKTVKGLMALERQGLVHHDIKGENVMLTSDGRVKIIDFGESMFGDTEGVVHGKAKGSTPGYDAPEGGGGGDYTSKVDTYALGGMIQKLVANNTPREFGVDPRVYEQGSMSRLINALKDDDPDKRPSLQAILMTSFIQSGESDFPKEDVEDLKSASVEFTNLLAKEKTSFDLAKAKENLPTLKDDLTDGNMKLSKLQTFASYLDNQIANLMLGAKKNPDKFLLEKKAELASLQKQRAYLQDHIINKSISEKSAKGQKAYKDAIDDKNKSITFDGPKGKETRTLKDAVARREQLAKGILDTQDKFYKYVSQKDVDPEKLKELNNLLTVADKYRKNIDDAIYKAMGPEAKFYLSKVKLEDVSKRFGPSPRREPQKEVQRDELDELINILNKDKETQAIKDAV